MLSHAFADPEAYEEECNEATRTIVTPLAMECTVTTGASAQASGALPVTRAPTSVGVRARFLGDSGPSIIAILIRECAHATGATGAFANKSVTIRRQADFRLYGDKRDAVKGNQHCSS